MLSSSSANSRLLKILQLRLDLVSLLALRGGGSKMSSWLNWIRWSEMAVVILPPLEEHARSLMKMLSIKVAELDVNRVAGELVDGSHGRIIGRKRHLCRYWFHI